MLPDILKEKAMEPDKPDASTETAKPVPSPSSSGADKALPREIGGPKGPEPTRYQDWERRGRCIDF